MPFGIYVGHGITAKGRGFDVKVIYGGLKCSVTVAQQYRHRVCRYLGQRHPNSDIELAIPIEIPDGLTIPDSLAGKGTSGNSRQLLGLKRAIAIAEQDREGVVSHVYQQEIGFPVLVDIADP
jgi:hypothetical protein